VLYLSASAVVIHCEKALYKVYAPLPLPYCSNKLKITLPILDKLLLISVLARGRRLSRPKSGLATCWMSLACRLSVRVRQQWVCERVVSKNSTSAPKPAWSPFRGKYSTTAFWISNKLAEIVSTFLFYFYPRRRCSTAVRILRSLCHDVWRVCGCVGGGRRVGVYVIKIKGKPLIGMT